MTHALTAIRCPRCRRLVATLADCPVCRRDISADARRVDHVLGAQHGRFRARRREEADARFDEAMLRACGYGGST